MEEIKKQTIAYQSSVGDNGRYYLRNISSSTIAHQLPASATSKNPLSLLTNGVAQ